MRRQDASRMSEASAWVRRAAFKSLQIQGSTGWLGGLRNYLSFHGYLWVLPTSMSLQLQQRAGPRNGKVQAPKCVLSARSPRPYKYNSPALSVPGWEVEKVWGSASSFNHGGDCGLAIISLRRSARVQAMTKNSRLENKLLIRSSFVSQTYFTPRFEIQITPQRVARRNEALLIQGSDAAAMCNSNGGQTHMQLPDPH